MTNAISDKSNFFLTGNVSFSSLEVLYFHLSQETWFFIGACADFLGSAEHLPSKAARLLNQNTRRLQGIFLLWLDCPNLLTSLECKRVL